MFSQHVRLLRQHGHRVVAVFRTAEGGAGSGAMPAWSGVEADEEVLLGPDQHLATAYPDHDSLDAVVCGMFQQVEGGMHGMTLDGSIGMNSEVKTS